MANPNADSGTPFADTLRHATFTPWILIECKKCGEQIGYERDRGKAWLRFADHFAVAHNDGSAAS